MNPTQIKTEEPVFQCKACKAYVQVLNKLEIHLYKSGPTHKNSTTQSNDSGLCPLLLQPLQILIILKVKSKTWAADVPINATMRQ